MYNVHKARPEDVASPASNSNGSNANGKFYIRRNQRRWHSGPQFIFLLVFVTFLLLYLLVPLPKRRIAQQKATKLNQSVVKLVCLSDTHGLHQHEDTPLRIPEGDFLIYAGDVALENKQQAVAFNEYLEQLPHTYKIVTFGNMDLWSEIERSEIEETLTAADAILIGDRVEVGGLVFAGSPITPKIAGVWQFSDKSWAYNQWKKILPRNAKIDVLVTHGPPLGYGDLTKGSHVGDDMLLKAVQEMSYPPRVWVTGHIHESHGAYIVPHPNGDIQLLNAAVFYLSTGHPGAQPFVVTYKPHNPNTKISVTRMGRPATIQ